VKHPEPTASILSSPLGGVPKIGSPELTNEVTLSQTPTTLEVVTSQNTEDTPSCNLAPDREREALKQTNIEDPNIVTHSQKKSRRARGRGRGKAAEARTQEDSENAPPVARENRPPHRGRAHPGSGRVETGTKPTSRRGRPMHRTTGRDAGRSTSRQAEGATEVDGTRDRGRSRSGVKTGVRRGRAPLTSHARDGPRILGLDREVVSAIVEKIETPKTDKANISKTGNHRRSVPAPIPPSTHQKSFASSPEAEEIARLSVSTSEGDVSTVPPLPSSTRRRAKEYFQRRTRERSVDAARRHIRPSLRSATVARQEIQSNLDVLRSQLDLKEDVGSEKPSERWTKEKPDQFIFDPEASPFTPNATSSPRQVSLSSIGVQSFSSPTPLPSRGNRKVTPLILARTTHRSIPLEMQSDTIPPLIPLTSQVEFTHNYSAANQAQAHLEAEQLALLRLQAYYTWLAGSFPASSVGAGAGTEEHMDMSGGGGGLGGGVALGRPVQNRGRGKCRNASGAYAHPKEHVVFSPRDHERMEVVSPFVPQKDRGQTGLLQSRKDNTDEKLEGEARRPTQKWDGKWGLREVSTSGKEVGWKWGGIGTAENPQLRSQAK
jgi:hypothetical protein